MLTRCRSFITTFVLCAALLAAAATRSDPVRTQVQDPKVLLRAAIDAPDGRAYGVLAGDIADAIGRRFTATSPLYIDVTTLARYAQEGCRRLNVRFWQEGVRIDPAAPAARQTIDMGLNYCRHGAPPASLRLEGPLP
ncbi:hypothetical protein [Janthinobacterium sp. PSPC3-1]|uniref:hypothetical protein n=1 Tax=Janthinobacterium sp. PSPC3-1 TaxID=2804653 RepID=UPI003CF3FB2D